MIANTTTVSATSSGIQKRQASAQHTLRSSTARLLVFQTSDLNANTTQLASHQHAPASSPTTTLLVTIVSTISLESSTSAAESSMISATVTSQAALSYFTIITSTETDAGASSDVAVSTSSVHHRHQHEDHGGWFT
ncbi:hypothetical protein NA56DRAFT_709463 [Hyaloscypha hepaticicola]|uniref:Uncharacterized protein n=1 Tax=Hyaloscypha hepaticicola TaxID=2082293 RepID=A0A2J6PP67_9HELO|nr:hypothetical protein NA56DRAFT_709463 [Hyaloscypha hepaticicola]